MPLIANSNPVPNPKTASAADVTPPEKPADEWTIVDPKGTDVREDPAERIADKISNKAARDEDAYDEQHPEFTK